MGSGLCMIGQGDTGGHTYTKRREQRQRAVLTRQKQDTGNYWSTICLFATKYPQLVYRLKKYIILLISVKTVKSHMLAKLHWRSMHIYIPKHAHMHSCMYEHTHTHISKHAHMHKCIHTHTHARTHACMQAYTTHALKIQIRKVLTFCPLSRQQFGVTWYINDKNTQWNLLKEYNLA